jgi:hypothetical protein
MSQRRPQTTSEAALLVGEPVGWGARLFGMFFLLPGLAAIWAYFNVEIQGEPLAALIVGGVFSLVGAAFVGAFRRVKIDRRQGFAEMAAGAFLAFKRTRLPLAGITHISLVREKRTRRGKNRTYTYFVYPVKLVGNEELECSDSQQYEYARGEAEAIARYLRLPIEDSSSGEIRRREYDELDESLAQRRRKAGERPRLPVMPVDTALHVHDENGVTTINLPPHVNTLMQAVITLVFSIPVYFIVSSFMGLNEPNTPDWFRYWVLAIVFVPVAWQVLRLLVQMQVKRSLVLTHEGLQYIRKFIFARTRGVKKQALEELDLQPGRVIATSDAGQLIIPLSVRKPDDSRFVYEMILYRLGR